MYVHRKEERNKANIIRGADWMMIVCKKPNGRSRPMFIIYCSHSREKRRERESHIQTERRMIHVLILFNIPGNTK